MVKSAIACEQYGLANDLIIKGIAAAFLYDVEGDEQAAELKAYVSDNGIEKAITHYTGIESGSHIYEEILNAYNEYKAKKSS